jgi:hypothetical protein
LRAELGPEREEVGRLGLLRSGTRLAQPHAQRHASVVHCHALQCKRACMLIGFGEEGAGMAHVWHVAELGSDHVQCGALRADG